MTIACWALIPGCHRPTAAIISRQADIYARQVALFLFLCCSVHTHSRARMASDSTPPAAGHITQPLRSTRVISLYIIEYVHGMNALRANTIPNSAASVPDGACQWPEAPSVHLSPDRSHSRGLVTHLTTCTHVTTQQAHL